MLTRNFGLFFSVRRQKAKTFVSGFKLQNRCPRTTYRSRVVFILSFFLIPLIIGCGGLSVKSKNSLVVTPNTISFGSIAVGQTATAKITLQNQGLTAVQIENISVTGPIFSVIGAEFPVSLAPGGSFSEEVQFSPTASGSVTEPLMITSDLSSDPTLLAQITGTGTASSSSGPRKIQLNWVAPDSPADAIVGYYIFRSTTGTLFQQLNSTPDAATSFIDDSVNSGNTYDYYVESIDAMGNVSGPSNSATVAIP